MRRRLYRVSKSLLAAGGTLTLGLCCVGQALPTATEIPDSRVDIYGGYGYFHPVNADINYNYYVPIYNPNVTTSISGYFGRYVGVQVEGGYFSGNSPRNASVACLNGACFSRDPRVYTAEAGPVLRLPMNRLVPYVHVLAGGARISGPVFQPLTWGLGFTGGIGVDYILPYFHDHIAIRPIQADYQYSHVNYGTLSPDGNSGGTGKIQAYKLSGGIVARFGVPDVTRPVEVGCTTQPGSVFPGEPVTVSASVVDMNPKKTPVFMWTTSGGKLTPHDSSAVIDTTGMAPGDYTVGGHLTVGKKPTEQATCTAPFTVKAYAPPTIACAASPAIVTPGTTVDISTSAMSPQNRPLTYSYTTTAGQIISNGPTAKLSTAGLPDTSLIVTCNVVDDLGKSASGLTQVAVQSPRKPVSVQTESLCSMSFERDRARPVRVDNEAKGCLDDIALTLNQRTDAQLFIIGNFSPDDRPQAGAERAMNIRQYLTLEKGVDPSRIYVRTGDSSGRTARTVLVPAGATFSGAGTQTFEENTIKRHGPAYGTARSRKAKHAAAPKEQ